MPWPVFLVAWDALLAHLALERVQLSTAALIGRADPEPASRAIERDRVVAFPEE